MSCICQNPEATQVTINGIVYCETLETMPPSCKPKSCPPGYTLSEDGTECTSPYQTGNLCPEGYVYVYDEEEPESSYCEAGTSFPADCICTADVFATPQTICSDSTTSIALTSTMPTGIVYSWVVLQNGVNGGTAGNSIASGNTITQNLITTGITPGTAIYTITPYEEGLTGCAGTPIQVTVTVKPIPVVTATPSSVNIVDGDPFTIDLTSNIPGTTFSWTVVNSGSTGGSAGSGNTITGTAIGAGTITYTVTPTYDGCPGTPIQVVITVGGLVISNNTKINIWFDNSGSMNTTLSPLQQMAADVLKPCLLPAYNNDSALYDSRVEVLNFNNNPNGFERYIRLLATTSPDPAITRVINLTFADESDNYGATTTYAGNITTPASDDITILRNTIDNAPANYLVGVQFQVATLSIQTGLPAYPGFRDFVERVHTGAAPFTGTAGLSDKPEIGYQLDVTPASTPQYYANLIINALNNLGFNLAPC